MQGAGGAALAASIPWETDAASTARSWPIGEGPDTPKICLSVGDGGGEIVVHAAGDGIDVHQSGVISISLPELLHQAGQARHVGGAPGDGRLQGLPESGAVGFVVDIVVGGNADAGQPIGGAHHSKRDFFMVCGGVGQLTGLCKSQVGPQAGDAGEKKVMSHGFELIVVNNGFF